jgi:hypothetical protein
MRGWYIGCAQECHSCDRGSIPLLRTNSMKERRPTYLSKFDGKPCPWCGTVMVCDDNWCAPSIEHIVPRSRLPKGVRGPTVIICRDCNSRKKDFTLTEWYVRLPVSGMMQWGKKDIRRSLIDAWLAANPDIAALVKQFEAIARKRKTQPVVQRSKKSWAGMGLPQV